MADSLSNIYLILVLHKLKKDIEKCECALVFCFPGTGSWSPLETACEEFYYYCCCYYFYNYLSTGF